jgi:predicted phosphoribosyltransferase
MEPLVPVFSDRRDAGRRLALGLTHYSNRRDTVVLALPRGGVPVGFEVASALSLPLDVFIVRKLGVPGHEELAMGAVASGSVRVLNDDVVLKLRIPAEVIEAVTQREVGELARRERLYRGNHLPADPAGHAVILVDDGLATGASMLAAVQAIRERAPNRIVVATPVGPREVCGEFEQRVDEVVCTVRSDNFHGVGQWYQDFSQTSDDDVKHLLEVAWDRRPLSGLRTGFDEGDGSRSEME